MFAAFPIWILSTNRIWFLKLSVTFVACAYVLWILAFWLIFAHYIHIGNLWSHATGHILKKVCEELSSSYGSFAQNRESQAEGSFWELGFPINSTLFLPLTSPGRNRDLASKILGSIPNFYPKFILAKKIWWNSGFCDT